MTPPPRPKQRLWPSTLNAQLMALLLLAIALTQGAALLIYRVERQQAVRNTQRQECLGRSISAYRLMDATAADLREEALKTIETPLTRYWLSPSGPEPASPSWIRDAREHLRRPSSGIADRHVGGFGERLEQLPVAAWQPVAEGVLEQPAYTLALREWNGFGFAMKLADGQWLNIVYAKPDHLVEKRLTLGYYLTLLLTIAIFLLVAWLSARRLSRPLRKLTQAAERIGCGEEIPPLTAEGPADIRATIEAFNRMQTRLHRFMEDRTRMLAAIGHDLRTPITSLRLRAEFVEDREVREKIVATLDEMQAMTEAALAFARSESTEETSRKVDLNALLGSLCDDLHELGWPVTYLETEKTPCICRPEALRRAVRNVIENAVRYGQEAKVQLTSGEAGAVIAVADQGPGIPPTEHEKVFAPFVRAEASRNTSTGGVGLGLAIARSILRGHGGDVTLHLLPEKGMEVRLHLPVQAPSSRPTGAV